MIIELDNLKLPPSLSCSAELFNEDTQMRTASGRLITKLALLEKWRVTVSFESESLSPALQAAFYEKCLEMRAFAKTVKFISPYDGAKKTIMAKCISRDVPIAVNIYRRRPGFYIKAGAVFEEV